MSSSRNQDDGRKSSKPPSRSPEQRSRKPRGSQSSKKSHSRTIEDSHPASNGVAARSEHIEPNKATSVALTDDDVDVLELPEDRRRLTILASGCIADPPLTPLSMPLYQVIRIHRDKVEDGFVMIRPVRLRLWHGEVRLLTEVVKGGMVYLTTRRLFRVWDDDLERQLAVPFNRIAHRTYEGDAALDIVCKDKSTFRLEFYSIHDRNIWIDVLDERLHQASFKFSVPLSKVVLPPSGDPEKELSDLRSAFFNDNETEAIGPYRKLLRGPAPSTDNQRNH